MDVSTGWGVLGPTLITQLAHERNLVHLARARADFYPIRGGEFWKPLLETYRDETEQTVRDATFLHLWHERYRKSGYDKDVAPVAGSFLHERFAAMGTLGRFSRAYGDEELCRALGAYFNPDGERVRDVGPRVEVD